MRPGYQVRRAGDGARAGHRCRGRRPLARRARRAAARGGCVVALPFADADLVALSRGELADLGGDGRRRRGAQIAAEAARARRCSTGQHLAGRAACSTSRRSTTVAGGRRPRGGARPRTPSTRGRRRSAGGAVPARRPAGVAARGAHRPAAHPGRRPRHRTAGRPVRRRWPSPTVPAATTPRRWPPRTHRWPPSRTAPRVRTARRSSSPRRTSGSTDATGAPRAARPPCDLLLDSGRCRASGRRRRARRRTRGNRTGRSAADPLRAGGREVPPSVIERVRAMRADVADLRSAAVPDTRRRRTADASVRPARPQAMLRAASAAWRGRPERGRSTRGGAAATGSRSCATRCACSSRPARTRWAASDAPLLLTVAQRAAGDDEGAGRASPAPPGCGSRRSTVQRIPPLGRRQVRVNAEVTPVGAVPGLGAGAHPGRSELGPPSRLLVRSTAYGTITVWLTVVRGRAARRAPGRTGSCAGSGARRPDAGPAGGPLELRPDRAEPEPEPADPAPSRAPPASPAPPATRHPRRAGPTPPDPDRRRDRHRTPPVTPGERAASRTRTPSLVRTSGVMAVASLVSRITGFLRQLALVARARPRAWSTTPTRSRTRCRSIVYELLLGGVLTSVMIPLLVRAQTEDADGGRGLHPAPAHASRRAVLVLAHRSRRCSPPRC